MYVGGPCLTAAGERERRGLSSASYHDHATLSKPSPVSKACSPKPTTPSLSEHRADLVAAIVAAQATASSSLVYSQGL